VGVRFPGDVRGDRDLQPVAAELLEHGGPERRVKAGLRRQGGLELLLLLGDPLRVYPASERDELAGGRIPERLWAESAGRVGPEGGADDGPTGG
jgi:hypothetical protein